MSTLFFGRALCTVMEAAPPSPLSEKMTPNSSLPDAPLQYVQQPVSPNPAHDLSLPSPNAVERSKNTFYGRLTGVTMHSKPKFYAAGAYPALMCDTIFHNAKCYPYSTMIDILFYCCVHCCCILFYCCVCNVNCYRTPPRFIVAFCWVVFVVVTLRLLLQNFVTLCYLLFLHLVTLYLLLMYFFYCCVCCRCVFFIIIVFIVVTFCFIVCNVNCCS